MSPYVGTRVIFIHLSFLLSVNIADRTRIYGDLKVPLISEYEWLWSDNGTGAARDDTFWHPKAQSGEFGGMRPLGSVGTANYNNINKKQATLLVGATSNSSPTVKSPTGYTQIWISKGMGGKYDNSTWRPIPPLGYVSMGDVVFDCSETGWNTQPSTDKVWCLRADLAKRAVYDTASFWDDKKGAGNYDLSVWQILPEPIVGKGDKNIPITAVSASGGIGRAEFSVSLNYHLPTKAVLHSPSTAT
ncbi:hypothetical protein BPOR_0003g00090 [Botrytis porri]|uniref:DUF946 domain-containing protein n=1 Tax=Botrytis porri TaxID=87229 RepID=A0A4Z1L6A0_9HELO|nr:hypothetical protein BPOR_0003g00090 [Botrytis porri]